MSHQLTEGTELDAITLAGGEDTLSVDRLSGIARIVVTMEMGQMSMVPWARVEYADGSVLLVNLAMVESAKLKEGA